MGSRNILPLAALLIAFSADGAFAQQTADIEGVKAASKAFYPSAGLPMRGRSTPAATINTNVSSSWAGHIAVGSVAGWAGPAAVGD